MKSKTKYVLIASALSLIILLCASFYFFYLKDIIVYKPFTIEINGSTPGEVDKIKVTGMMPFNKERPIAYDRVLDCWWSYYEHYNGVRISIPETMMSQTDTLIIISKNERHLVPANELQLKGRTGRNINYLIPASAFGEQHFLKKLNALLYWNTSRRIIKYVFAGMGLIFLTILGIDLFRKRFSLKKIAPWIKSIVLSVFIACLLYFGYLLFLYTIATYLTAVLFIIMSGFIIWLLAFAMIRIFRIADLHAGRIKRLLIVIMVIWFCAETIMRIKGTERSYNERTGSYYMSGFSVDMPVDKQNPHLHVHPKYDFLIIERKEFKYPFKCNADGLRDVDHPVEEEKGEYRIICLGDSYTEGVGTPQDSTWPRLLQNKLRNSSERKITVFNAGVSSSDPFFEYMLLKERLLKYKPDLVLISLSYSDIEFYRFRGGFERFTPDGFKYLEGPAWEKLYAISHIFRYIMHRKFHYKYLLVPEDLDANHLKANEEIYGCIQRLYQLSLAHQFSIAVIFNDDRMDWYKPLSDRLKNENIIPVIDLYDYNTQVENLTDDVYRTYRWPVDGHYIPKGYDIFARGVEWNLKKMGVIDSIMNK